MPALNNCQFIGHLGGDVTFNILQSGKQVANFSLAVNDPYNKDAAPTWVRVAVWGKRGEVARDYLKKGDPVFVQGDIKLREYEKDGETKTSLELNCQNLTLLGGGSGSASPASKPEATANQPFKATEDEIPF